MSALLLTSVIDLGNYTNSTTRYTKSTTQPEKWSLVYQGLQPPGNFRTISTISTIKRIGLLSFAKAMLYNEAGAVDLEPETRPSFYRPRPRSLIPCW